MFLETTYLVSDSQKFFTFRCSSPPELRYKMAKSPEGKRIFKTITNHLHVLNLEKVFDVFLWD